MRLNDTAATLVAKSPLNLSTGLYAEKWESSEGRTEIHYFRLSDDEYLFGYNPILFPDFPEKINEIYPLVER